MEPFVSVVVPIYNVEKYLSECLDSLERQTLKNIEVIMVNDGSTDSSENIAESYAVRNDNFTLVNRENGGLSAARNTGLDIAKGEYVYFLDSDDFLAEDALEKLYGKANSEDLDILNFVAYTFEDEAKDYSWKKDGGYLYAGDYPGIYSGIDLTEKLMTNGDWYPSCCLMLTRRSFLTKASLRFREGIIHEDVLFRFEQVVQAERIAVLNEPLYFRRIRAGSITQSRDWANAIRSLCVCAEESDKFIKDHYIQDSSASDWHVMSILRIIFFRWNMLPREMQRSKELRSCVARMRPLLGKYGKKADLAVRVFYTNIPLYGVAHKIMEILKCMKRKFQ